MCVCVCDGRDVNTNPRTPNVIPSGPSGAAASIDLFMPALQNGVTIVHYDEHRPDSSWFPITDFLPE